MPALVAVMSEEPSGALAYRLLGDALHIVALATDPMWQRSGVGGYLVAEAEMIARRLDIRRLVVSTTNDNLPALSYAYGGKRRLVERVGLLSYLCVLGFRRIRIEPDALARLERRFAGAGLLPANAGEARDT